MRIWQSTSTSRNVERTDVYVHVGVCSIAYQSVNQEMSEPVTNHVDATMLKATLGGTCQLCKLLHEASRPLGPLTAHHTCISSWMFVGKVSDKSISNYSVLPSASELALPSFSDSCRDLAYAPAHCCSSKSPCDVSA